MAYFLLTQLTTHILKPLIAHVLLTPVTAYILMTPLIAQSSLISMTAQFYFDISGGIF